MAMNQRVQKILLELMRERHSLYAGFTDVELKSILKSHAGDVSALDWNEACEYAKSMGVSKKSHTTRDAYRDACRSWFDGRERAVFVPARAPNAPRQRWQRAGPTAPARRRPRAAPGRGAAAALSPGTSSRAKRTAPHEGYSSDEADEHPRPPRVVAADTIEPSSDEDDDEADRDIARLMVAGVAGGRP
ncbi:hypothetical protein JL720_8211 [Aureococcus anophagefferens]|nr:hypothetical protein JL720_8211 [Aureococcus anophagefferens]